MTTTHHRPRVAVVSPFLDKQHGTERCIVEQLQGLADEFEFHVYSTRVSDLDLNKIVWHRIPDIPGPLLIKYCWFFCTNHISRWRDRTFRNLTVELTYSPGINCFNADLIAVHIVFAEFLRVVREDLRLRNHPPSFWPRLLHRRLFYRLIVILERRIYVRPDLPLIAVSNKVKDDLWRFYGRREGLFTIHNGIDCDKFNPAIRKRLRTAARMAFGYSPQISSS